MLINITHNVEYTNRQKIPIIDIASSLTANETLLTQSLLFIEKISPNFKIEKVEVNFSSASHNSPLHEAFVISLYLAAQEDLTTYIPLAIEAILGKAVPDKYKCVLALGTFLLALEGFKIIKKRIGYKKPMPAIETQQQTIINHIGVQINVSNSEIENVLKSLNIAEQNQIAKAAKAFAAPARRERNTSIIIDEQVLPSEVIAELPDDFDLLELENEKEISTPITNALIQIRATDIDHNKSGWAGVIQGVHDKRLKMSIYPSIDLNDIYGKDTIKGDVILVSKLHANGNYKPYMFHLIRLVE